MGRSDQSVDVESPSARRRRSARMTSHSWPGAGICAGASGDPDSA
ncbi:hypothetical protein PACID_23060 [Acidipropionibacterium acidipropionici ATCC 4875]|uniref:Uncharacterized protein n=1 Tax=Acidipropionibacterium acidipropionici (strain ATCC 4875 / DSM 20272 / JCM 6432 / NBRC 12425 / NCIMB 8070 / 4) TaxID=1171373 RepID=K7RYJ9_ACIA4|nr:hypothetical protein PACID_23060 [Acidipropionibacterium acidipropionici ATCC 4875]